MIEEGKKLTLKSKLTPGISLMWLINQHFTFWYIIPLVLILWTRSLQSSDSIKKIKLN